MPCALPFAVPRDRLRRAVAGFTMIAVVLVTVARLRPPADAGGVDEARLTRVLRAVAAEPHPPGSPANDRVRDFLADELRRFGYDVTIQRGEFTTPPPRPRTVPIGNIVATLPGTADTGDALLLAAHFDSRPDGSHGAGDDAAGVAAVVEAAAQLATNPPRNDVVVLLTDAEEAGLLGAWLWADRTQPGYMNARVALNFEGRGSRGPAILFETGPNSGWLVDHYAAATPYPVASSLAPAVYSLMPNATDFTVFRSTGGDLHPHWEQYRRGGATPALPGLNFAFVGGYEHYHRPSDRVENLSRRTLMHHARQATAVSRRLADAGLRPRDPRPSVVYFDVASFTTVAYGGRTAWTLALVAAASAGIVLIRGVTGRDYWRGRLGACGVTGGLLAAVAVAVIAWSQALALVLPHPSAGRYYGAIFFSLASASTLLAWAVCGGSGRARGTAAATCTVAAVLGVVSAGSLPGVSYLPTGVSLAAAAVLFCGTRFWWIGVAAAAVVTALVTSVAWSGGLAATLRFPAVPATLMLVAATIWLPLLARTADASVAEVSPPGEDHGGPVAVDEVDRLPVPDAPPRLDDRRDAGV